LQLQHFQNSAPSSNIFAFEIVLAAKTQLAAGSGQALCVTCLLVAPETHGKGFWKWVYSFSPVAGQANIQPGKHPPSLETHLEFTLCFFIECLIALEEHSEN
jgi:hypothetical protein